MSPKKTPHHDLGGPPHAPALGWPTKRLSFLGLSGKGKVFPCLQSLPERKKHETWSNKCWISADVQDSSTFWQRRCLFLPQTLIQQWRFTYFSDLALLASTHSTADSVLFWTRSALPSPAASLAVWWTQGGGGEGDQLRLADLQIRNLLNCCNN